MQERNLWPAVRSGSAVTAAAGIFLCALALSVLTGWALEIESLKSVRHGYVTMKPMTAAGFLMTGIALYFLRDGRNRSSRWRRSLGLAGGYGALLIGGTFALQYLTGWNFGLDALLFSSKVTGESQPFPGRMAPFTSFCFVLAAVSLLSIARSNVRVAQAGAYCVAAASLVALTGYVYDASALYTVAPYESMAWHTGLGFLVASCGSLAAGPEYGLAAAIRRRDAAGILLRRLVPAAILIPLVLGQLRIFGEDVGLYASQAGTAILMVSNMFVFLLVLALTTGEIIRTEGNRSRLATIVEFSHDAIIVEDLQGRIEIWNPASTLLHGYRREEVIGRPSAVLVPSEEREEFSLLMDRARRGEAFQDLDARRMTKTGLHRETSLTLSPLFDSEGQISGVSVIARDITERRQLERRLRRSEADLRMSQSELRALATRLISAQEHEARRIARELHDVFAQELAAVGMDLASFEMHAWNLNPRERENLDSVIARVDELARSIHSISKQLHPAILEDLGLAAALESECDSVCRQFGIDIQCQASGLREQPPEMVALTIYRIAQEALHNAARHSAATEIRVLIDDDQTHLTLRVEDNGRGFDPLVARHNGGLGLVSMEERVRLVRGSIFLRSSIGSGATVEVQIPWRQNEADPNRTGG